LPLLEINRDECTGCGACVEVCPFGSLILDDEDIAVVDETCTACGACLPECPVEALILPETKVEGTGFFCLLGNGGQGAGAG